MGLRDLLGWNKQEKENTVPARAPVTPPKAKPLLNGGLPALPPEYTKTLSKTMQAKLHDISDREQTRIDILNMQDPDMKTEAMKAYLLWSQTKAKLIVEMEAPWMKDQAWMHLKKGGILYLEPLGYYFFPKDLYEKTKGTIPPDDQGFFVNVQDCRTPMEVQAKLRACVQAANKAPITITTSSDAMDRLF